MTTEEQDQQRLKELQERRDEMIRQMDLEVQRNREYILFGTWTPRTQDGSKS